MPGTVAGGHRAAKTNRSRYGKNFYKVIGQKGGESGNTGGFASQKVGSDGLTGTQRAKVAGARGGFASRRKSIGSGKTVTTGVSLRRTK